MPSFFYTTSTTSDGNMSPLYSDQEVVRKNQHRWLHGNDIQPEQLCLMQCDHGEKIIVINHDNFLASTRPPAEVLITNAGGIALGLLTADCIPAVFHDPVTSTIALAHLNRKTIAHDLAKKVVAQMQQEFQVDPTNLLVYFEPHIHAASYVFPLPLQTTPTQLIPYIAEAAGAASVDFPAAHRAQLIESGVPESNITSSTIDVATDPHYFSYYQHKRDNTQPHGRHLTVALLT